MLTLKKVKEMVKAPAHTKRVPSPKVLLEEGRIFLRKEFEHGSHLTLYHNGYVWFSAGKRSISMTAVGTMPTVHQKERAK